MSETYKVWDDGVVTTQTRAEFEASLPPATVDPQPERLFSFLEFMDLFTESEQAAMAGAAMTDVAIKLWYDRAMGAQGIYLSDQRTIDGVDTMVESNLLTRDRADAVLRGEVP